VARDTLAWLAEHELVIKQRLFITLLGGAAVASEKMRQRRETVEYRSARSKPGWVPLTF
jgi:hypothetical protein